jgi:hypothetical protein
MKKLLLRLTIPLVCFVLLAHSSRADAQFPASGKQAAGIFGVLIGAAVGVGVGVYLLVRAPRNITGCVSNDANGIQLLDERSTNRYLLEGDSAAVVPGQRVCVQPGKDSSKRKMFSVDKVSKNYGACKTASPQRSSVSKPH